MRLRTSSWTDLVYHLLACLPVGAGDASNLYDSAYRRWAEAAFASPERTLAEDAAALALLYRQNLEAHLLHAFVLLYDDERLFLERVRRRFGELDWPDEERRVLARQLERRLSPELIELFRIALWCEARAGYLQLRDAELEACYRRAIPALQEEVGRLAERVPGLSRVDWIVSHPLRRHGRLLQRAGAPLIVTGIATPDLGVSCAAVLLQGLHEFVLCQVQALTPAGRSSPRRDAPHFAGYLAAELTTLTLTARLLAGTADEAAYREWLAALFPKGCGSLPELPWGVPREGDLIERLTSGELAPPQTRDELPALLARLRAGDVA